MPNNEQQIIDTSTPEFQSVLQMIRYTHQSVFLTGKAGTGKSTLLRYVREHTRKKCVVLAPTGIAAINAGGATLHSFFKLPFHPLTPDDSRYAGRRIREFLKYDKDHIQLLRSVELIIIDEISMVRADIIDFVDRILRTYTHNHREPFGGKQMLFVGDVFQLEPVVKTDERDILARFYPSPYFFSAHVFKQMELVCIELTKVYRQHDADFVRVLDRIRTNQATSSDLRMLNSRVGVSQTAAEVPTCDVPTHLGITLCTRRDDVDFINNSRLAALDGDVITFHGRIQGDFPQSSLPTLLDLEIKLGAQVIFVKNDQGKQWVNGTLGIVTGISESPFGLIVMSETGEELLVEEAQWSNVRYTYNEQEKKIEEEELGTFTQFPIRLAWAITIHKSQGLTFQRVNIDFGTGTFAGGQAYVALSRCTSLEGIALHRQVNRSDVFVRPEIVQFASQFNNPQALNRALQSAQADIEYAAAANAFDEERWDDFITHFFTAIHARYEIETPLAKRLIRRKLGRISQLSRENEALAKQLKKRTKMMHDYAKEYYLMGNDCITEAGSYSAAIRNYEKAISLWPEFEAAHKRLGDCYDHEGKPEEAAQHWEIAAKLHRKAERKRKK